MPSKDSFREFCHFDEAVYRTYVSSLNAAQLSQLHALVTRKDISAATHSFGALLTAPFTGGFSLVPGAIAGRCWDVNHRRKQIVEERIDKVPGAVRYEPRKRDYAVPATGVAVLGGLSGGLEGDLLIAAGGVENIAQASGVGVEMALAPVYAAACKRTGLYESGETAASGARR